MSKYTESSLELATLAWLKELEFDIAYGPNISPISENQAQQPLVEQLERESYQEVVLVNRLKTAINKLNPSIPTEAKEEAIKKVLNVGNLSPNLVLNNKVFHSYLTEGVDVEFRNNNGEIRGDKVRLIDYKVITNNHFLAVNQFTVIEQGKNRRPDVVVFINGLPLIVFELKNLANEKTTIKEAYNQLQTYKNEIPSLLTYNEILVISDGLEANAGTLTSPIEWFLKWKSLDGEVLNNQGTNELKVLIKGMFKTTRLLDLIRYFITFQENGEVMYKILAAYHQYFATNKAVKYTHQATQVSGSKKVGIVWHTQGSGKSLTMTFYTGKIIQELNNPTVVVLTDRNDLDNQLYNIFSQSVDLLRQTPRQADNREEIQRLLQVASGGVVFTTIQKFLPEGNENIYPLLSNRKNIIVIADEAHRSQYGFKGRISSDMLKYGYAKYLRDALPNASFIGFTGTPIALKDKNTAAVFGNVIDTYDITQAVADHTTVPIYYEARLAKIGLDKILKEQLDQEFEEITEGEDISFKDQLKSKWARLEAMVGSEDRIKLIAKDIVKHFTERRSVIEGKGMIVTMSRRIAVDLYTEIVKLRPEWHSTSDSQGFIKVVMTGSASDPETYQPHIRNKKGREELTKRMKDANDPLKLVIVCDMWLTGFDVPAIHTMYLDKPLQGHTLMQAIARVNRIFKDKQSGLIVDYIGIAYELQKALSYYTKNDQELTAMPQEEALIIMTEKFEVVKDMFYPFKYKKYFESNESERTELLTKAIDYILGLEQGANRYKKAVTELSYAFSIAIPHQSALDIRDEVAFFQAVKAGIIKLEPKRKGGPTKEDYDQAIKAIIADAIISDEVIDIFKAAGISTPNVSILSDEFLAEVKGMEHKNIALEILKKLLNEEIKAFAAKNLVMSKSFLEMLEATIKKYQNRTITSAQVIAELVELAKKIQKEQEKGKVLGLTDDEVAFYDALAENESALTELGDETLKQIARELVVILRKNTTIDWTIRESIQAKLRIFIKRLLKKYNYPPDKQERATKTVLEQAELLAKDWTGE